MAIDSATRIRLEALHGQLQDTEPGSLERELVQEKIDRMLDRCITNPPEGADQP